MKLEIRNSTAKPEPAKFIDSAPAWLPLGFALLALCFVMAASPVWNLLLWAFKADGIPYQLLILAYAVILFGSPLMAFLVGKSIGVGSANEAKRYAVGIVLGTLVCAITTAWLIAKHGIAVLFWYVGATK